MQIINLRTISFRNLADSEVFTGAKDIFLIGENGQGKSNFLEALYYCAYASSFRSVKDNDIVRNGENASGRYNSFSAAVKLLDQSNEEILVKFERGKKSVFIDGKKALDRKELLSIAPTIVFCHEDMEFISGNPERRRWFFDQTLSLYDPVYLEDLRLYKRVLKTRNAVLRENIQNRINSRDNNIEQILDALDPQLAEYGQKLMEKRTAAAHEFSEVFTFLYEKVSGIRGITVQYNQSWRKDEIIMHLQQRRAADIAAGISLSGPHRDKYIFAYNEAEEFTVKASTGQKRLLALLLRTAQAKLFSKVTNQHPILLLDDVLLEMDGEKRRRFLEVLPAYSQAFYTFLPDEPYNNYRKDDTIIYKVKNGIVNI